MIAQNQQNPNLGYPLQNQYTSTPGSFFPILQHVDPSPTTPGGDGSSNKTPGDDFYTTQELGEEEDEEVYIGKGKGKGTRGRWVNAKDLALVSGILNCGGDIETGTDQTKAVLWKKVKEIYDTEAKKSPNIIHERTMKSLKSRWSTINEVVTLWVSQKGEAERLQASGMAIDDVEEKANELYSQQSKCKSFAFQHCYNALKDRSTRWKPGQDSTNISGGSSKRSSDEAGMTRPVGVKKFKAQKKMKEVALKLDEFNSTLSGISSDRGSIRQSIEELIQFQKDKEEKKMRWRMLEMLMNKPDLDSSDAQYLAKLKEEFFQSLDANVTFQFKL
ncbi:Glutathione S-transferase T3 [Bienertia sinuspersici]